jgi:hypothetical protein
MEMYQKDTDSTLEGEISAISCPIGVLCTYGIGAVVNFVPFQGFHSNIKPKGFMGIPKQL